jgi:hypothetical protein
MDPEENTFSAIPEESTAPTQEEIRPQEEVRLVDVPVTNGSVALNLMASFLNVAQRRGTFSIDESAKIWECLRMFTAPPSESNA